jgi:hypothetical protein
LNSGGPSPSPADARTGKDTVHRHTADSKAAQTEAADRIMGLTLG